MCRWLRGWHIDVSRGTYGPVEFTDALSDIYRLCDCDIVDTYAMYIGFRRYNVICDKKGRLRENPKVSAVEYDGHPALVGNLIILAGVEGRGFEMHSITAEDERVLGSRMSMFVCTPKDGPEYNTLAITNVSMDWPAISTWSEEDEAASVRGG